MTEEALSPLVLEMHDQFDRICFCVGPPKCDE